jgi:hypothetical protein
LLLSLAYQNGSRWRRSQALAMPGAGRKLRAASPYCELPSSQRVEACLGVLQVSRVKPLGEPPVDRREELTGGGASALALPQATQAHRRPQLPGLRLLRAGDNQRLLKTRLRLRAPPGQCWLLQAAGNCWMKVMGHSLRWDAVKTRPSVTPIAVHLHF